MKKQVKYIFLHCSDSEFGTSLMINKWHMEKDYLQIGYSEVVQNGYPTVDWFNKKIKVPYLEGAVEIGRAFNSDDMLSEEEIGAHVLNYNDCSYGTCMIGKNTFSDKVLNSALDVIKYRMNQFHVPVENVWGHCEADKKKTCPNIDMNVFRDKLRSNTYYGVKVENNKILNKFLKNFKFF